MPALKGSAPALSAAARKARLLRGYVTGAPVHCTWQLSPRCESFCHLCEHRAESAEQELDADECARIAHALGADGSLIVSFTGSEPFLRGDFQQIVAAVARRHFPLLVTNGWLVTREAARAVWEAGLEAATVALEHAQAGPHDAATGLPGSHARAVAALRTLAETRVRRRQRVNVRSRLRGGERPADLEALLRLARECGATVTFEAGFPLPQLGSGGGELAATLRQLKRRHPHLRSTGRVIDGLGQALEQGVPGCLAGKAFFNVDHRGRVTRCVEFRRPADRIGSLQEAALRELRPRLREAAATSDCRACYYASRAEVETLFSVRGFVDGIRALVSA